jgi:hypothetical protein
VCYAAEASGVTLETSWFRHSQRERVARVGPLYSPPHGLSWAPGKLSVNVCSVFWGKKSSTLSFHKDTYLYLTKKSKDGQSISCLLLPPLLYMRRCCWCCRPPSSNRNFGGRLPCWIACCTRTAASTGRRATSSACRRCVKGGACKPSGLDSHRERICTCTCMRLRITRLGPAASATGERPCRQHRHIRKTPAAPFLSMLQPVCLMMECSGSCSCRGALPPLELLPLRPAAPCCRSSGS